MFKTECDECGEYIHPGTPCRTPEEILNDGAPTADEVSQWAAEQRARRIAAINRRDAQILGR